MGRVGGPEGRPDSRLPDFESPYAKMTTNAARGATKVLIMIIESTEKFDRCVCACQKYASLVVVGRREFGSPLQKTVLVARK
jgi:hypothetical protein